MAVTIWNEDFGPGDYSYWEFIDYRRFTDLGARFISVVRISMSLKFVMHN